MANMAFVIRARRQRLLRDYALRPPDVAVGRAHLSEMQDKAEGYYAEEVTPQRGDMRQRRASMACAGGAVRIRKTAIAYHVTHE